jgi:hypothetical protein
LGLFRFRFAFQGRPEAPQPEYQPTPYLARLFSEVFWTAEFSHSNHNTGEGDPFSG